MTSAAGWAASSVCAATLSSVGIIRWPVWRDRLNNETGAEADEPELTLTA
jgi:hypothetical protein